MNQPFDRVLRPGPRLILDTDVRQAQRTFDMEKLMEPFIHHQDCGCTRCRPAPVSSAGTRFVLPLVLFLAIIMIALIAGTFMHFVLG